MRNAAIAAGWDQVTPLTATVTVNDFVGGSSTGAYAFRTGSPFPAGSSITIINNHWIVGAGGAGGNGAYYYGGPYGTYAGTNGGAGNHALAIEVGGVNIYNNGVICAGGGGGGGGGFAVIPPAHAYDGGGGGGGNGVVGGIGGSPGYTPIGVQGQHGAAGTYYAGGTGGLLGIIAKPSGGNGGSYGAAGGPGSESLYWVANPCDPGDGYYKTLLPATSGGAGGYAVVGNSNGIWHVVGNRYGTIG